MSFTAGQMLDIIEAAGYPTMWVSIPLEYDVTTWTAMLDSGERVNFFETMVSAPQIAVKALMVANAPATPSFTIAQRFDCRLVAGIAPFDVLYLQRCNGTQLFINGANYPIIAGGVSKSVTGLSVATLYYVYAYWTGTIIALEFSTTPFAGDAEHDHLIKTGDGSRTYVGMVYMPAAGLAFKDNDQERFVASYFNRINKPCQRGLTTNRTATAGPWVELNSAERIEFICHGEESSTVWNVATASHSAAAQNVYAGLGVNGAATQLVRAVMQSSAIGGFFNISKVSAYKFTLGYNFLTTLGGVDSGTGTYYSSNESFGAMLRQ